MGELIAHQLKKLSVVATGEVKQEQYLQSTDSTECEIIWSEKFDKEGKAMQEGKAIFMVIFFQAGIFLNRETEKLLVIHLFY